MNNCINITADQNLLVSGNFLKDVYDLFVNYKPTIEYVPRQVEATCH
jgi:hypothetical protein